MSDEELVVKIIAWLTIEVETKQGVICNLTAMNDELQAKVDKIEQIIDSEVDPNICNNVGDVRKVQAIKKILEEE